MISKILNKVLKIKILNELIINFKNVNILLWLYAQEIYIYIYINLCVLIQK